MNIHSPLHRSSDGLIPRLHMTEDNTELLQSLYRKVPRVAMTMQIICGLGQELSFNVHI